VALVFCCTLIGAIAQILIKSGANGLNQAGVVAMLTNVPLMAGYSLYGVSTVLLVIALKDSELSLMYPIISLTYVWVTVLSVLRFHETLTPFKAIGVATIVAGVAVLGKGGKK
jgi:multidrug transporter EmrE-like cation transporter